MIPITMRKVSGLGLNRLGVNGSLSMINSLIANCAILLDVPAESILTIGLGAIRIRPLLTAQAIAASAVIGRKPATTPIPIDNVTTRWFVMFSNRSLCLSQSKLTSSVVRQVNVCP